jgi:hypothetical protein
MLISAKLIPELDPVSNFHAIPRKLRSHSYFSKLNDEGPD